MCMFKIIGEFQAVSENSIECGMSENNNANQTEPIYLSIKPDDEEQNSKQFVMENIIQHRTDLCIPYVADHRNVRCQEESGNTHQA